MILLSKYQYSKDLQIYIQDESSSYDTLKNYNIYNAVATRLFPHK